MLLGVRETGYERSVSCRGGLSDRGSRLTRPCGPLRAISTASYFFPPREPDPAGKPGAAIWLQPLTGQMSGTQTRLRERQREARTSTHSVHCGPGLLPSTKPLRRNMSWPHMELHDAQKGVMAFQPPCMKRRVVPSPSCSILQVSVVPFHSG